MSLIESIRPGGSIEGNLGRHPLGELLVGVLRGNLSGRLDLALHPDPRNRLIFREGVPVLVELPDLGPTLIALLVEEGLVGRDLGLELVRTADAATLSESQVVARHGLLSGGTLREARVRRAESQVVRLFDAGEIDFRFTEGREDLDPSEITLLDPLPLLFRGFRDSREGRAGLPYLPPKEAEVSLGPSFPAGLDPFRLGPEFDEAVRSAPNVEGLVRQGWPSSDAKAAVASLALADMLEVSAPRRRKPRKLGGGRIPSSLPVAAESAHRGHATGLVVHRRRSRAGPDVQRAADPVETEAQSETGPAGLEESPLSRRLGPLEQLDYFQILRVSPDSGPSQLERAHRFLQRRLQEEPPDVGREALSGILQEAFTFLRDRRRAHHYQQLGRSERQALEAEVRGERAARVLGEGRHSEAVYLLQWARRLDPARSDLDLLVAAFEWLASDDKSQSSSPREALTAELARSGNRQVRLALACVLAQHGESWSAKALLGDPSEERHPLVERFVLTGDG